jgi:hypothetical protein
MQCFSTSQPLVLFSAGAAADAAAPAVDADPCRAEYKMRDVDNLSVSSSAIATYSCNAYTSQQQQIPCQQQAALPLVSLLLLHAM